MRTVDEIVELACRRVEADAGAQGWVGVEITTDPAEAPADALLEAAGYYVEPGDMCLYLWWGKSVIHNKRGGYMRGGITHSELTKNLKGWDPYSWDVKRPRRTVTAQPFSREATTGWVSDFMVATPCHCCSGTGKVHGVFLPNSWDCDVCDGKGVV